MESNEMKTEKLRSILEEGNFQEAVELSRLINLETGLKTAKFNHAICLEKCRSLEEAVEVLEDMYLDETLEKASDAEHEEIGILNLNTEVTKDLVIHHLLNVQWKLGNETKALEILENNQIFPKQSLNILLSILSTIQSNYVLRSDDSSVSFQLGGDSKEIEFKGSYIDPNNTQLPKYLQKLSLVYVGFVDGEENTLENLNFKDWIPETVNSLNLFAVENILDLEHLSSFEYLTLIWCTLSLDSNDHSKSRLFPKELTLHDVSFVRNGERIPRNSVNDFIDFRKMEKLELNCCPLKKNISVDLSQDSVSVDYLCLLCVQVFGWKESKWVVRKLELRFPFVEKTQMDIQELYVRHSDLDISVLPQNIHILKLCNVKLICGGTINLPNLKFLELTYMDISFSLPHFNKSSKLTHLHLIEPEESLNLGLLPPNIKQIKITINSKFHKVFGEVRKLEKLVLEHFSFHQVIETLKYFQPEELVVSGDFTESQFFDNFTKLTKENIKTITIGTIDFQNVDFQHSTISKYVDRRSEYYSVDESGSGKGIDEKEFKERVKIV